MKSALNIILTIGIIASGQLFLSAVYCQSDSILNRTYQISFDEDDRHAALMKLSMKTGYNFSYNSDLLKLNNEFRQKFKQAYIKDIISQIFNDTTIYLEAIEKQIVIKSRTEEKQRTFPYSSPDNKIFISGKVIDKSSGQPVPFANITIPEQPFGTLTNLDGEFIFKVPYCAIEEKITISCLGYSNLSTRISDIYKFDNIFSLEYEFIPIQQLIIRQNDPRQLVMAAIRKIDQNYSANPVILTSFYRESVLKNAHLQEVSEALIKIYKPAYNSLSDEQIKIIKGRRKNLRDMADSLDFKLKAGLETTMLLDIVNNEQDFIKLESIYQYDYKLIDIVRQASDEFYVIGFKPKNEYTEALFEGRLYIEIESLAIHSAEFALVPYRVNNSSSSFIVKKPRSVKIKLKNAVYKVTYKEIDGTNYLAHVRYDAEFRVRKKKEIWSNTYNASSEMVSLQLETENIQRFRRDELAKAHDIFKEQLSVYDPGFWEQYNYIKPEETLIEALSLHNFDNNSNE